MKKVKRLFVFATMICLALCLAACGVEIVDVSTPAEIQVDVGKYADVPVEFFLQ